MTDKDVQDSVEEHEDVVAADNAAAKDEGILVDEEGNEQTPEPELDPVEALEMQVASLKDQLLRAHAETENVRKRMEKQIDDARKFGVEKFAASLLDVVDNLERALAVDVGNEDGLREGVQMTLDSWQNAMSRFELKRIDATGEMFNPHLHEALAQMPSDQPEGTVIAQHVAGYTLHGRLVRSAKVLVSGGSQ